MSAEAGSIPTIDMRSISQLAEGGEAGDQFVVEIIDVFLGDLDERVVSVGSQMSENDRAGVAATAHAIKGSSGHFGAATLVELSRNLEDRARHEAGDIQPAIDLVIAEAERVRAALETFRREASERPGVDAVTMG